MSIELDIINHCKSSNHGYAEESEKSNLLRPLHVLLHKGLCNRLSIKH